VKEEILFSVPESLILTPALPEEFGGMSDEATAALGPFARLSVR
jgi:hypothetical protein